MKTYKVYFKIGGKKLMMKVEAKDQDHAREVLKSKLIIENVLPLTVEDMCKEFNDFIQSL